MAVTSFDSKLQVAAAGTGTQKPALILLGVLYFMMGFITCLNDTLVPFFKTGFELNYAESSLVQFYFFVTYAIMSVPAGRIVERIGYKKGMVLGFAIAGLGAFLFLPASWWHRYELFLGALFILALGIVLLQVAANPYITLLGKPETASSRLTLIQGIGSIGTTVAPLFGAHFILSRMGTRVTGSTLTAPYLGIGLTLVLIAVAVSLLALPRIATGQTARDEAGAGQRLFAFRNLKFGVIAIFMYVGAEVAIGTFLTNYIADLLSIKEHAANSYVAFYWGGMLAGRLMGAALLKVVKPQQVLVVAALTAGGFIVTSILTSGMLAVWMMIAVGICNSVMFAIIFSLAVKGLGSYTTRASGLLSTAIVGGAVVPYFCGVLVDSASWVWGFLLVLCCYLYLVFYGVSGYKARLKTTG
ncbi:sugar MFS transporter [Niabella drilacis]|uniref:MFS transporter, FHS family, L-fucose permease n=1 Tax=Niabella drilacis (strain DSM 25811 / CCM 8410 / CCUG 62505 / LMG 26954 / E90) TaxID=1285928 RepID=A0A1G6M462_NIADE|nr:sugar MFS transporter [Niabella drilacis]SDC50289.1 MFS transporter, FHS family, L-fucose permease [Niabella drilacis]